MAIFRTFSLSEIYHDDAMRHVAESAVFYYACRHTPRLRAEGCLLAYNTPRYNLSLKSPVYMDVYGPPRMVQVLSKKQRECVPHAFAFEFRLVKHYADDGIHTPKGDRRIKKELLSGEDMERALLYVNAALHKFGFMSELEGYALRRK